MRKFYTLILLVLLTLTCKAQNTTLDWAKQITGGSATPNSMVTDASGNIYITGVFLGTADFDPGPGVNEFTSIAGYDAFILKLDANGNFLWANHTSGSANVEGKGIALDPSGNIYTIGEFYTNADFGTGPGAVNLTSQGDFDIYIQKLDNNGVIQWIKQIGGSQGQFSTSIAVDVSGNVHFTGGFYGSPDFDPGAGTQILSSSGGEDIYIAKLNTNGDHVWSKKIGGSGWDQGTAITTDANGNVYTTGYFTETIDFDPGAAVSNLTNDQSNNAFVSKLDVNGDFVWAKGLGGTSISTDYGKGKGIAIDLNENVFVIGEFEGTIDFDPNAGVQNYSSAGSRDIFVEKFSSNGDLDWVNVIGNSDEQNASSIVLDNAGAIYIAGYFEGVIDVDPSPSNYSLTSAGSRDFFVENFDANGNMNFAVHFGGTSYDWVNSLALDNANNIHLAGSFNDVVDFDPGPDTLNFTSLSSNSMYTLKLGQCSPVYTSLTAESCESYDVPSGNQTYFTSGMYNDTLSNSCGADSILTIDLTINTPSSSIDVQTACGSFLWVNGVTYTSSTDTATYMTMNTAGCDSIVTLDLTINIVDVTVTNSDPTLTATASNATYQWIDCDNGNVVIASATNQSYTPTINGNYAVIVTENGCSDTSACYLVASSDVTELNFASEISIYPNPTSQNVTIDLGEIYNAIEVQIVNPLGQIISSENYDMKEILNLELTGAKGVYYVVIQSENKKEILRIIKN
jgi:hypothetical protein